MPRRPRDPGVPQSPAEYFGTELRAYREAAGLGRPQLAAKLGYSAQWIGQVEGGKAGCAPGEEFANDCDTCFGTNGTFHRIWKWNQQVGQLEVLLPGFAEYLRQEEQAVVIHKYEAMAMPGLLQTREYAYEMLKEGRSAEETDELVSTRLRRARILEGEDPCHVVVVFDEGAVRRAVGNRGVMRAQVQHLICLAQRRNVTLHIIPSSKGVHPGLPGSFTTLEFEDGSRSAYVEGYMGGQLIERGDVVRGYALCFDLIRGAALPTDESLVLLQTILEELC
ncbi:helix-turn-helix domain-containing protein [Actinomadura parmotrematis]|uniref:Helix-turn-helix domain-containing protein n=1 Tax=Actinomadura parmotrematis TaxID=2864039 RepID=A0ABS7FTC6_9ACTN|nr:helix-turn-helix transcriptional regulator [Actinomadura parmotrematis]MBW8483460.1 helix-turn-helix domain-containing protein [Actinomadura parmotrematis]